jgi:hypothetical protein
LELRAEGFNIKKNPCLLCVVGVAENEDAKLEITINIKPLIDMVVDTI